ncbi:hypothetical protein AB0C52_13075 [Streptomyces sp. NPDC048717]|uniref:hypothetical protein n=1 Tax=Streptomyces sp. NPDC048717 TaxID=3154928 RepID=UPI0034199121
MQLTRQTALRLMEEGKAAYAQSDPADACPYDAYSADAEQQFGAQYWGRGWGIARTAAEALIPEPEPDAAQ